MACLAKVYELAADFCRLRRIKEFKMAIKQKNCKLVLMNKKESKKRSQKLKTIIFCGQMFKVLLVR